MTARILSGLVAGLLLVGCAAERGALVEAPTAAPALAAQVSDATAGATVVVEPTQAAMTQPSATAVEATATPALSPTPESLLKRRDPLPAGVDLQLAFSGGAAGDEC